MNNNIFIPKKINVGFQERNDTYTKKLAYVIYYDNKGVLRKETSWQNWREDKIPNIIYDNVPISGFVLNKKVGDYCSDWNHRQAYVRVYDPRDFEFEITVENLLYILENTSSIKGKGLEGEFVYSWDGKDLLLLPASSPDYAELTEFNKLLFENKKIKAKELILGATYKTKSNDEWIYMGRFGEVNVNKGKRHFFAKESINYRDEPILELLILKSLGDRFIDVVSTECVENYSQLFDKLECKTEYSPYDKTKDEYIEYTFEELQEEVQDRNWVYCFYNNNGTYDRIKIDKIYDRNTQSYYPNEFDAIKRIDCWRDEKIVRGSLEEIHTQLKPSYKNEYLKNGKFLQRSDY